MKKFEMIFVAVLLVISLAAMGFMAIPKSHDDSQIMIKVNNVLVKKVPVNYSNQSKTYAFEFNQHTGYIETKSGKVRMLEMSKDLCPNGICSKTGWIDQSYQSIVCLPNKITVTLDTSKEKSKDGTIDFIP